MKTTLFHITTLFLLTSIQLLAQQINFSGTRVIYTTGSNIFIGQGTGAANSSGSSRNTFVGYFAGYQNTTGGANVFIGNAAGQNNTTGLQNTFAGNGAGYLNTTGGNNSFWGNSAGVYNTTGGNNTFSGSGAGSNNTTASNNTFIGTIAGTANTTGSDNIFAGSLAGNANTVGYSNAIIGTYAGVANTTGYNNTLLGIASGHSNTSGSANTYIGQNAGSTNTTGNNNTLIGSGADVVAQTLTNATAIGSNARVSVSDAIVLGDPANASLKVGIGTDAPQFPLDVKGVIYLRNRGTIKFSHLTNPNLRDGSTDQFLTVNEQGETLLARYRLTINNPNEWSDKVFAPAYQLQPLASVAAYVGQHGHLPGVPSAEQVVREGVDMTKLNATLLEKIEELTLYSIQLEKANQVLQQKQQQDNQQQQAEINELKRLVNGLLKKK